MPLLILIHLVAVLLPVRPTPAFAQGGNCLDESANSAMLDAPFVPVAADQEVTISKETVDKAVLAAYWKANLDVNKAYEVPYIIENLFMLHANTTGWSDVMQKFQDNYTVKLNQRADLNWLSGKMGYDTIVHTLLDVALETPELAPYAPLVWQKLSEYDYGRLYSDVKNQVAWSAQRYPLNAGTVKLAEQSLIEVYDCAQKNPIVAETFDKLHKDRFNVSIRDSAKTVFERNPDLPVLKEIRDKLGDDGTISMSLNELKALSEREFDKLHATIGDMQKTIKDIDERQKVIVDYLSNRAEQERLQAIAKKEAAEYQLKLDAAQASISILGTIATQIDPAFAKDFNVVATSALQIGKAVKDWLGATAGLDGLDKVFSLSTVVMTGNVLGAVMNIVGLFGPEQPSPEEMILEEIGKLRQQVDDMRLEMHDRFNRIDEGLNAIFTTMHDRFHQIDVELGKLNGNIVEVQQSLAALDGKLSRIERNNFELFNAVSRRPLLEAVNGALGYRQRTGLPMPQVQFDQFENQFHSWATIHAFDPGNVGPTERNYSDAELLTELSSYPIDANLNYLNGWMLAHGLPPISNKPLPSPRDWLLASRAYIQLGVEEPELMATYLENAPQRQAQLEQIGLDMEAALQKIATQVTAQGPRGNHLLFSTVITHYQSQVDGLEAAIQTLENNFIEEIRSQRLGRSDSFDFYGGPFQSLSNYRTPEYYNMTCGNAAQHGSYPTPVNVTTDIPNFHLYNLADYLKVGSFAYCLSDEWANQVEVCQPKVPNGPIVCETFGNHKAFLTVYFDSRPILTKMVHDGVQKMPAERADAWSRDNWMGGVEYKTAFETQSFVVPPTPAMEQTQADLLAAVTSLIEQRLASYQQELYGRILDEMNRGTLKAQANALGGSKLLLDHLVTLGLPRAVNNNEFVHAMLYGNQQLVDTNRLMQAYATHFAQPIALAIRLNPRDVLAEPADQRLAAFGKLITKYLDAITAKEHVEAPDYLVNTREALALTMRIVQIDPPPRRDQTINFGPLADKLVAESPFALNASASSGLAVSFTSSTTSVCTVNGNLVTLVATGTCTIQASQAGNLGFNAAPPVTQSFTVAPQGGSAGGEQKIYLPEVAR